MIKNNNILIGKGNAEVYLNTRMANRHGLIAGATGTGKSTTVKILAEGFSQLSVPVFLCDIKGDMSSLCLRGENNDKISDRIEKLGLSEEFSFGEMPCRFWDVFGKDGIPLRATVSSIGPVLLARLLDLTDAQAGVLNIAFHVADENGWKLIDFKDLHSMLMYVDENKKDISARYGNVATQSIGAIQRALLNLKDQGAEQFFGEPELDFEDWLKTKDNKGIINILHGVNLYKSPLLYSVFMLWMLSEVYENMPEVGDLDKPKLVFFFDEAHLLFNNAPKALLEKIIQVIKLVRSKGIGIYFISQNPSDIPDEVLSQLNNRIMHALHAYTPAEMKAVKTAAMSFRVNPLFKTEDMISNMGTGVALVSTLGEDGVPSVTEVTTICPPQTGFAVFEGPARLMYIAGDELYIKYKDMIDNESAYEIIEAENAVLNSEETNPEFNAKIDNKEITNSDTEIESKPESKTEQLKKFLNKSNDETANMSKKQLQEYYKEHGLDKYGRTPVQASLEKATKNTARSAARSVGKEITRGVLGTSNKTVNKYAGQMFGNLASDLIGSMFKRK